MLLEHFLITTTAGLANVLGIGMLLPQARRIARTRTGDGVSGAWVGAGVAINLGWLLYAMSANVWGLLPVSAGSLVMYVRILILLAPVARASTREALRVAGGVLAALGVSFTLTGTAGLGLTLSACYTVQFAPAAWAALRQTNLSGISPATWIMATIEAVLWAVYGSAIDDLPVALGGFGAAAMSMLILVCLFTQGRPRAVLPGISTSPKTVPTAPLTTENT